MRCLFHEACFDPYHFALSLVVVLALAIVCVFLGRLVISCIYCAIHTCVCYKLTEKHVTQILDSNIRISDLEKRLEGR